MKKTQFYLSRNSFVYNQTLHCGRKYFCCNCLQAFSTEEILKWYINDYFKINGKQMIHMPKESEYVKFKNYKRKTKSPFMIYILVPEHNEKPNPDDS